MTSAMGDNHLPESLSGHCGCFRYHELNTHKVTKDQIPCQPGGWVLHQPPWSFGFDSQTRGTRENRRTLC